MQVGDLESFLQRNEDTAPATRAISFCLSFLTSRENYLSILSLQPPDFGEPFVKATYNLEGDGPLALKYFEIVDAVSAGIQVAHAPNVEAIALVVSQRAPLVKQQLIDYAKRCVQPGLDYFRHQLESSLKGPRHGYSPHTKCTQCSQTSQQLTPSQPFLVDATAGLKAELPTFLAKAADVSQFL